PRATNTSNIRESSKGKVIGRTMEIQRLSGRALRPVVEVESIGERTIWIDCDDIQADGDTHTPSTTGACVGMAIGGTKLFQEKKITKFLITDFLVAISVGVLENNDVSVDLDYEDDSEAQVDMNVVMTGSGEFVEIQGTGEEATFSYNELEKMLAGANDGITQLFNYQKDVLGEIADLIGKREES